MLIFTTSNLYSILYIDKFFFVRALFLSFRSLPTSHLYIYDIFISCLHISRFLHYLSYNFQIRTLFLKYMFTFLNICSLRFFSFLTSRFLFFYVIIVIIALRILVFCQRTRPALCKTLYILFLEILSVSRSITCNHGNILDM